MAQELLLSATKLIKSYNDRQLFSIAKLSIYDRDRIALVGHNGCGKTTLLNLLSRKLDCDKGKVYCYCDIAMIKQTSAVTRQGITEKAAPALLRMWNVNKTAGQSGGERTRITLADIFSKNCPLLLADEPSTNLDVDGLSKLEKMLCEYPGAVVLVSHDRSLIDAVCTQVWSIEDGGLRVFPGNYSEWIEQRNREREYAQFEFEKYRHEKKRLTNEMRNIREEARNLRKPPKHMGSSEWKLYKDVASRQQRNVQSRAKVMETRIAQMEEKLPPSKLPQIHMGLGVASPVSSKTAVKINNLTVRYESRTILQNVSLDIPTGSKTVMLGKNGAGKTTIANEIASFGNTVWQSDKIKLGYFSQGYQILDFSKSVLENVRSTSSLPEHEVRTILANMLIAGNSVFKSVGVLSGGECAKVTLAKLLASDSNFLLLDEPTNHLDLYAAEALEALLDKWQGTLLVITHDRRLTEKIADRLLFVENKTVRTFEGGWLQWQEDQKAKQTEQEIEQLVNEIRSVKPSKQQER